MADKTSDTYQDWFNVYCQRMTDVLRKQSDRMDEQFRAAETANTNR